MISMMVLRSLRLRSRAVTVWVAPWLLGVMVWPLGPPTMTRASGGSPPVVLMVSSSWRAFGLTSIGR